MDINVIKGKIEKTNINECGRIYVFISTCKELENCHSVPIIKRLKHDSHYMRFQKGKCYEESEKAGGCQGLGGGMNSHRTERFTAVKIFYNSTVIEACNCTFVQKRRMCNTKVEPSS